MSSVDSMPNLVPEPVGLEAGGFGVVALGTGTVDGNRVMADVFRLKDADGNCLFLPRIFEAGDLLAGPMGQEAEVLEADREQLKKLYDCMDSLKMPPLVAVHLVFNRPEVDLDIIYGGGGLETAQVPVLVGISGRAGEGKSTTAAVVGRKHGWEVANMALFDELGAEEYVAQLEARQIGVDEFERSMEEIGQLRERNKGRERQIVTLGQRLDNLATKFEKGQRPEKILLDMPGWPRVGSSDRCLQVPDVLAHCAVSSFLIERQKGYGFEEAVKWYWNEWPKIAGGIMADVRRGDEFYKEVVKDRLS